VDDQPIDNRSTDEWGRSMAPKFNKWRIRSAGQKIANWNTMNGNEKGGPDEKRRIGGKIFAGRFN
jgi:hypothetical protein